MKILVAIGIVSIPLAGVVVAEWRREPLASAAKGEWRHLFAEGSKIYSFGTGSFAELRNERTTVHRFFWHGKLALELTETEGKDDLYFGNTIRSMPEAGVTTESWDYDKDGVVDVVRIGRVLEQGMLLFGRYRDGVFALAPSDLNFTELWAHLKNTESEQVGAGQPATRSESESEGGDKPQPQSEGRSR